MTAAKTAHRMRWFVYSTGEKLPRVATMRGTWDGYDVQCSCGWETRTGGAIKSYIDQLVWEHKNGYGDPGVGV
jgi:hypothetical protein